MLKKVQIERPFLLTLMLGTACIIAVVLSVFMAVGAFGSEKGSVCLYPSGKELIVSYGALEDISEGYRYTEEEIRGMLSLLDETGTVGFEDAVHDVYLWHEQTGADIAALCALVRSEGTYRNRHGADHWNFFLLPARGECSSYGETHRLWDAKKDCRTIGEALVKGMDFVADNYFEKGQDSFYEMSFGGYGFPQNLVDAEKSYAKIKHSYLPYWEDTAYIESGYASDMAWVNRLTRYREEFGSL